MHEDEDEDGPPDHGHGYEDATEHASRPRNVHGVLLSGCVEARARRSAMSAFDVELAGCLARRTGLLTHLRGPRAIAGASLAVRDGPLDALRGVADELPNQLTVLRGLLTAFLRDLRKRGGVVSAAAQGATTLGGELPVMPGDDAGVEG